MVSSYLCVSLLPRGVYMVCDPLTIEDMLFHVQNQKKKNLFQLPGV